MSLEFGSSGFSSGLEGLNQSLEQFNSTFANLEGIQNSLFKKNAEGLEFMHQSSDLTSKLELASQKEFFNAHYQETPIFKELNKLKAKCLKAKTTQEISSIRAEYEKLMGKTSLSQYESALNQQGINGSVVVKNAVKDMSAPLELYVGDAADVVPNAVDVVKNQADDSAKIAAEALKRTQKEEAAKKTAEQAQKFYSSLSDVTTGKSAKESAEVIEASLKAAEEKQAKIAAEALKRTQKEEAAKKTAEQAQKFYSSLSDVTTGKSAKESAEVIKQSLDKADEAAKALAETKKNAIKVPAQQLALPPKKELLALPPHNVTDKADDVVKAAVDAVKTNQNNAGQTITKTGEDIISFSNTQKSKNIIEKTKSFVKDKAIPFTKTKQFKIIAAGTAALAITLGIIKHNKDKQENNQKLNIVK